jgi:hypothetical protein
MGRKTTLAGAALAWADLLLKLVLLFLLHHHLVLIQLLYRFTVNILVEVGRLALRWLAVVPVVLGSVLVWLLLDPQVLGRLEIVSEDRNDLANLLIRVLIDKETRVWIVVAIGLFILRDHAQLNFHLASAAHRLNPLRQAFVLEIWVELSDQDFELITHLHNLTAR